MKTRHRTFARWLLSAAILFLSVSLDAARPQQKLSIDVGATHIDVKRVTPGGAVLLIGYERTSRDGARVFRRVEREGIAAADGTARMDIGRPLAPNSFWVALDLQSAAYAAASADGSRLREGEFLPANFRGDSAGRRRRAVTRFDYVHALVVRRGTGVWQFTAGDGGPADADGLLDGAITIEAPRFEKRRKSDADLDEYADGDLLILFIPRQMGYLITEVGK